MIWRHLSLIGSSTMLVGGTVFCQIRRRRLCNARRAVTRTRPKPASATPVEQRWGSCARCADSRTRRAAASVTSALRCSPLSTVNGVAQHAPGAAVAAPGAILLPSAAYGPQGRGVLWKLLIFSLSY